MAVSSSTTPAVAVVPVKSAFVSKINWTQIVGAGAMLLTVASGNKAGLTADQQAAIVTTIGLAQAGITWILRTWFNGSVNPASLPST